MAMATDNTITEKEEKPKEDFMTSKWRPMMAIMYMCVCVCDFILFPIMWTVVQFWETQAANDAFRQWQPMTLQGGGLFHMAMGAVLGITAWSRGQEKIAGVATPSVGAGPSSVPPTGFNGTSASDFPQAPPAPVAPQIKTGFGGKPAPQQEFPLI